MSYITFWKARSFIKKDTFCEGNTAVINIDKKTFFALNGNLIAKIDENNSIHIKHGGNPSLSTRNHIANIIDALNYPFTVKFKNPDNKNRAKITLIYKHPKNNMRPIKRITHEIHDTWTDIENLKDNIEKNTSINNTTDNNNTTNNNKLSNALTNALNLIIY